MIVLVLIGFILLALWQIPSLIKNCWWREFICFAVLWSMGLILSIMVSIGIKLPPISTIIGKSISGMLGL
jgi:hypothetical protein